MRNPPAAAQWLSQIEGARSAADLVRVLREYVGSLNDEERAQLPAFDGAGALTDAADVQEWAVTLAQFDLKEGGTPELRALHDAAVVFAAAGAKLAKVGG